jgi:hypothetical protein
MRSILIILLLTFLIGCVNGHVKVTDLESKTICEARYTSFFKDVDSTSINACGAGGSAEGSKTKAEFIGHLMQFMAK